MINSKNRNSLSVLIGVLMFFASIFFMPGRATAYSVLTHEAVVDACWEKSFVPLLKNKYPAIKPEQLKEAHAYAYGGAIMPDMGYFPFGSHFFTNLVHYVRNGDFENALLDEAQDANEYAFALGCLCHYMSDKYGHSLGTNYCVALAYPKLEKKFGHVITYEENEIAHRRMEFSFDVLQTARGNYASQSYHDFIGFKVARPLLERAFSKTYGMDINDVFGNLSLAISTFRWSVQSLFPELMKAAWVIKKKDIQKLRPDATSRNFKYKMHHRNYYQEYGKERHRPGFFANTLALLIRVLPKVGPLKVLKVKAPGPAEEKLFINSFDTVLVQTSRAMNSLSNSTINFNNIDFDTGADTYPGEYTLADKAYEELLFKLQQDNFYCTNQGLKSSLMQFFNEYKPVVANKRTEQEWAKVNSGFHELELCKP